MPLRRCLLYNTANTDTLEAYVNGGTGLNINATVQYFFDGVVNHDYDQEVLLSNANSTQSGNKVYSNFRLVSVNGNNSKVEYIKVSDNNSSLNSSIGRTYYTSYVSKNFDGYEVIGTEKPNTDLTCWHQVVTNSQGVTTTNAYRGRYEGATSGTKSETYRIYRYYVADEWKDITFYNGTETITNGRNAVTVGKDQLYFANHLNANKQYDATSEGWTDEENDYKITVGSEAGSEKSPGTSFWYQRGNDWVEMSWAEFTSQVIVYEDKTASRTVPATVNTLNFYYSTKEYPLTLKGYDGVSTVGSFTVKYNKQLFGNGGILSNSANKPTAPEGYEFDCWSTSLEASEPYTGTMPAHALVLYARYRPVRVTVTTHGFDWAGQVTAVADNYGKYTQNINTALRDFAVTQPHKEGENFAGWYKDAEFKNPISLNDEIKEDTTIYPKFTSLELRGLKYDVNGGTGEAPTDNKRYVAGAEINVLNGAGLEKALTDINGNTYTANFVCWNTKADGTGVDYYNGDWLTIGAEDGEPIDGVRTMTLYAQYNARRETTLVYNLNASDAWFESRKVADGVRKNVSTESNGTIRLVFKDYREGGSNSETIGTPNTPVIIGQDADKDEFYPRRVGYRFDGWSTVATATEATIHDGDTAYINTLEGGNNVLYAVWIEDTLPVNVYTYTPAAWKPTGALSTSGLVRNQSYVSTSDTTLANAQSNIRETDSNTLITLPLTGYSLGYGGAGTTEITGIRYVADGEGYVWQYAYKDGTETKYQSFTKADGAYIQSLDLYYYPEPASIPVYYVTLGADGAVQKIAELKGQDGNPIKINETTVAQGNEQSVASTGTYIGMTGSELVVPGQSNGGQAQNLIYKDNRPLELKGFAFAADNATTIASSNVNERLKLWNCADGVQSKAGAASSDDNPGNLTGLANGAIYVVYEEEADQPLTINGYFDGTTKLVSSSSNPYTWNRTENGNWSVKDYIGMYSGTMLGLGDSYEFASAKVGENEFDAIYYKDHKWYYMPKGKTAETDLVAINPDTQHLSVYFKVKLPVKYWQAGAVDRVSALTDGTPETIAMTVDQVIRASTQTLAATSREGWLGYAYGDGTTAPANAKAKADLWVKLVLDGTMPKFKFYTVDPATDVTATAVEAANLYAVYFKPVCKITQNGTLQTCADGTPAVYATLAEAFDAINNGTITGDKIEMLVENYTLPAGVSLSSGKTVTLTTASSSDTVLPGPSGNATITRKSDFTDASMITSSGALTISNLTLSGGDVVTSGVNGGIVNAAAGSLTISSGVVMSHSKAANGGAIYVASGVTATESDLDIEYCQATLDGGGIWNAGTFTFGGGELDHCTATGNGGGMYNSGTVTMTEDANAESTNLLRGSFENCSAQNGGAIYTTGNFEMTGGEINSCTASGNGGGIYKAGLSTVRMSSSSERPGVIKNCSAQNGGGIYVAQGELDMTGGTIQGCHATGDGGGVYNNASFKIQHTGDFEAAIIEDCYAGGNGGAIYENNADDVLVLTDVTIQGHTTGKTTSLAANTKDATNGGGIYVNQGGINISNCRIYDCTASSNGGALYDNSSKHLEISGTTINGHVALDAGTNNAGNDGGGIYMPNLGTSGVAPAWLGITNSKLYNLTANRYGGAIYNEAKARNIQTDRTTVTLTNTNIDGHNDGFSGGNNAQAGGGIYMQSGWLQVNGGEINNCTVSGNGGAIFNMPDSNTAYIESRTVYLSGVTLTGDSAGGNGGGVYMKMGRLTVDGCTMTSLRANQGAAVYADTNNAGTSAAEILMKGGSITDCTATGAGGGAINVKQSQGSAQPTITFEGAAQVYNNSNSTDDPTHKHNVVLEITDDGVIRTSATGLTSDAVIGVYVMGNNPHDEQNQGDPYKHHGNPGQPFGTHGGTTANTDLLSLDTQKDATRKAFVNDRDGSMYGIIGGTNDAKIVWHRDTDVLEITKIWEDGDSSTRPTQIVVHVQRGTGADLPLSPSLQNEDSNVEIKTENTYRAILKKGSRTGDIWTWKLVVPSGIVSVTEETLPGYAQTVGDVTQDINEDYFVTITNSTAVCKITVADGSGRKLYKAYSSLADAINAVNTDPSLASATDIKIEMLVPTVTLTSGLTLESGKTATITTAARDATDGYPYTGDDGTNAAIKRGTGLTGDMITNEGNLTLTDITLDGNGANVTGGALVANGNNATLTLTDGATLTGNKSDAGAVTNGTGAAVNLSGSATVNNNTKADGTTKANVVIGKNSTLNVTGNLTGTVGVYVDGTSGESGAAVDSCGKSGQVFGSVSNGATGLDKLVNDRIKKDATNYLKGAAAVGTSNAGKIMWEVGTLTIKELTTGAMGDFTQDFTFTLTVDGRASEDFAFTKGEATDTIRSGGTFTLKNGETITLNVPYDVNITIAETAITGYTTKMKLANAETAVNTLTDEDKMTSKTNFKLSNGTFLTVNNDLPAVSPTGVTLTYAPYVLMLLLGAALLLISRRKKEKK